MAFATGMGENANSLQNQEFVRVLRDLALGASVEVLARQLPAPEVLASHLRCGTAVYVPFPPKVRWPDTIAACRRALAAGMVPVPHLPARSVRGPDELRDWLSGLPAADPRGMAERRPRGVRR